MTGSTIGTVELLLQLVLARLSSTRSGSRDTATLSNIAAQNLTNKQTYQLLYKKIVGSYPLIAVFSS